MVEIRSATEQDAEAIASLHARVWRATYHALAPASAMAALTTQARLVRWRALLHDPAAGQITPVADGGDTLAGFGQLAPSALEVFEGRHEIKFLYVGEAHRARGIGRRLMTALAGAAIDQDARGVALGVVDGNDRAIEFYRHLGGRHIGRYTDAGPVWRSDNLVYAWDDLASLAGRRVA